MLRHVQSDPLPTPADVLAERLRALSGHQATKVAEAWRDREDDGAVERAADALVERWDWPGGLPPQAGEPGWDAGTESRLQLGLDRLLALCHPDIGAADPEPLSRATARELQERQLRDGWWHRSEDLLLLPRRLTTKGLPDADAGPFRHTSVVAGDAAQMIEVVVRPLQEDDEDRSALGPYGAADCAVAPLVGAEALTLDFERRAGNRWTYGPRLDDAAIDTSLLQRVLTDADSAGATVLVLPEYCCSPRVRQRWLDVLRRSGAGSVRWLLAGSGPTAEDADSNVGLLLSREASVIVEQPKIQPFDLRPDALNSWSCPDMPDDAKTKPVTERNRVHRSWTLLECNGGRMAIAVCESFRPEVAGTSVTALGAANPTLLLCPVFSQPTDKSRWERAASERWGDIGTQLVVANSVVVAEWQAQADGDTLGPSVACGAARALDDSSKRHGWKVLCVPPTLVGGTTSEVARDDASA